MIHFNYEPYEEDIVIAGKKGSRKSTRLLMILQMLVNESFIVWDFSNSIGLNIHKFSPNAKIINSIDMIKGRGKYIVQEKIKSEENFRKLCKKIFDNSQLHSNNSNYLGNTVFAVDEIHQYYDSPQKTIPELNDIVMSGRNFGISGIYISTIARVIPHKILANYTHAFIFKHEHFKDGEWLEKYVGREVWKLFSADIRRYYTDEPNLNEGSFLYRDSKRNILELEIK